MTAVTLTDETAYINVEWDGSTLPDDWRSWRVFGKRSDDTGWQVLYETFFNAPTNSYQLYQFIDGVPGDYAVAYTTQSNATSVITELGWADDASTIEPQGDAHFWVIDISDPSKNLRLEHVTNFPLPVSYTHLTLPTKS